MSVGEAADKRTRTRTIGREAAGASVLTPSGWQCSARTSSPDEQPPPGLGFPFFFSTRIRYVALLIPRPPPQSPARTRARTNPDLSADPLIYSAASQLDTSTSIDGGGSAGGREGGGRQDGPPRGRRRVRGVRDRPRYAQAHPATPLSPQHCCCIWADTVNSTWLVGVVMSICSIRFVLIRNPCDGYVGHHKLTLKIGFRRDSTQIKGKFVAAGLFPMWILPSVR